MPTSPLPADWSSLVTGVDLQTLRRVLVTVDPRLLQTLLYDFRLPRQLLDDLPISVVVKLSLADWLAHLGFVTDLQIKTILDCRGDSIAIWARTVHEAPSVEQAPGLYLTISDARWVHTNLDVTWLDLYSRSEVESLAQAPVTSITLHVLALYKLVLQRIQRRRNGRADDRTH